MVVCQIYVNVHLKRAEKYYKVLVFVQFGDLELELKGSSAENALKR